MPEVNVGQSYNATGESAKQEAARREAQRRAAEEQQKIKDQVATYNRQLAEYAQKMRDMQLSAERTQMAAPPTAQDFSPKAEEDKRFRRSSSRGSLLAGNTGGYNPATGGGKLGGRSLLG